MKRDLSLIEEELYSDETISSSKKRERVLIETSNTLENGDFDWILELGFSEDSAIDLGLDINWDFEMQSEGEEHDSFSL
jgi:hypothetical protein